MNNLTNEQKARIFAMYVGQVLFDSRKETFYSVNVLECRVYTACHSYGICDSMTAKLLLRPLSAISDEDAIEVAKMINWGRIIIRDRINQDNVRAQAIEFGKKVVLEISNDLCMDTGSYTTSVIFAYQYLISKGYSVPLFIAPGHPDNGKTAIELGIAIDATTLKTAGHE